MSICAVTHEEYFTLTCVYIKKIFMKSKYDKWEFLFDNSTGEYWWVCKSVSGVKGDSQKKFKELEDCKQDAKRFGYPENYKAPINSEEFWNE